MPAMSELQNAAFRSANSGAAVIEPAEVNNLVVGVLVVMIFLWVSWVCLCAYRGMAKRGTTTTDTGAQVLRVFILMMIMLAFIL